MKPLYLDWNLGLGDAIICNGLVRWFARYGGRQIIVPSWPHNLPTVRHMFSDLDNVTVHEADETCASEGCETMRIGVNNPKWGSVEPWDRAFYDFADVPFDAKWNLFHVPPSPTEISASVARKPFVLLHEDVARGFEIDGHRVDSLSNSDLNPVFVNKGLPLLTDWRHLIEEATEIHCIDSSVMHLAELLPTKGKLFYHKYARAKGNPNHQDATFRKNWVVLE